MADDEFHDCTHASASRAIRYSSVSPIAVPSHEAAIRSSATFIAAYSRAICKRSSVTIVGIALAPSLGPPINDRWTDETARLQAAAWAGQSAQKRHPPRA